MRTYKHVSLEFASAFADCTSIAIGTYSYYRNLPGERADEFEGRAVANQKHPIVSNGFSTPLEMKTLQNHGLYLFGPNAVVSNYTFITVLKDAHIFCSSRSPDFERVKKFEEAIFEISDIKEFARQLRIANRTILGKERVAPVKYKERQGDVMDGNIIADAFVKNPKLEFEKEIRIVWTTSNSIPAWLTISAPEAKKLVRRIG